MPSSRSAVQNKHKIGESGDPCVRSMVRFLHLRLKLSSHHAYLTSQSLSVNGTPLAASFCKTNSLSSTHGSYSTWPNIFDPKESLLLEFKSEDNVIEGLFLGFRKPFHFHYPIGNTSQLPTSMRYNPWSVHKDWTSIWNPEIICRTLKPAWAKVSNGSDNEELQPTRPTYCRRQNAVDVVGERV